MTPPGTKVTYRWDLPSEVRVADLRGFLIGLPDAATVTIHEAKAHPGEFGVTPGYIEVSYRQGAQ